MVAAPAESKWSLKRPRLYRGGDKSRVLAASGLEKLLGWLTVDALDWTLGSMDQA